MSHQATTWNEYVKTELPKISQILSLYGITLAEHQPHTQGERFLMQAVTTIGGEKLILIGEETITKKNVVIKATTHGMGREELLHERACRTLLHKLSFSYDSFQSPAELFFIEKSGYTIFVTEYIEQTMSFLERPIEEQFTFALKALKAQERTRATTAKHLKQIKRVFGSRNSEEYLKMFEAFVMTCKQRKVAFDIIQLLEEAKVTLMQKQERIEQYGNFLTHTDFVPHNFRIKGNELFLLDFSSLRFGNKHEGWARFLNFMTLYNRDLETLLITYVEKNRSPEERESLQLMRLFRLGEIITYYVTTLDKSTDSLLALNQSRINFWSEVLKAELTNTRVSETVVKQYCQQRDRLRSKEEKVRQIGLH